MKSKHILPMVLGVLLIGIVVGVFVLNEDVSFTDLFSKSFFGLTGKVIWENADADAFGNGTYYNTTWDSGVGAVVLLNGSMECPDNQGYNSTTRVNMTGNILLLHMNGGGGVQELPNNQANSWMDMSNNIILLHMDDDNWGDSSGNENNGSTGGEATFVSPGKLGSHAGIFDGVNDFVNLDSHKASIDFNAPASISLWFKSNNDARAGNGHIFSFVDIATVDEFFSIILGSSSGGIPNEQINIASKREGIFRHLYYNNSVDQWIGSNPTWHHLVVTLDGSTTRTYLDGSQVTLQDRNSNDDGNYGENFVAENARIAMVNDQYGARNFFNGSLDEMAIWNRTLSANEITEIYAKQKPLYLNDSSGLENNGRGVGEINCSDTGKLNEGCNFVEQDLIKFVSVEDDNSLDFGTGDYSISIWVKTAGYFNYGSVHNSILYKGTLFTDGYGITLGNPNGLSFRGGNGIAESTTKVNDSQWHHVVGVRDSSLNYSYIYIDGDLETTDTTADGDVSTNDELSIGRSMESTVRFFNGTIDEVAIWNRSLSASEISNLYYSQYGKYYEQGEYVSEIVDFGSERGFNNVSWTPGVPYQEELPDSQEDELQTTLGGANMTGNVLLMHMNNAWTDASGFGNNGTADGATFTTSSKLGSHAGSFDGVNDWVYHPTFLDVVPDNLTFSTWFKSNGDAEAIQAIFSKINVNGEERFYLFILNNILRFDYEANNQGYKVLTFDRQWVKDTWYYVAITWDTANGINVYLDGILSNSSVSDTTLPKDGTDYNFGIGAEDLNGQYFNGTIDEVAIWNRSLSASEIQNIYLRGAVALNLSVRSCDDALCDTETWNGTYTDSTYTNISDLVDNQYFQYKFAFTSNGSGDLTPELYNVSLDYGSQEAPAVSLVFPSNNSQWTSSNDVVFTYNVSSANSISYCNLSVPGVECPDNQATSNNMNMTGNVLLMHMNNAWNDYSGQSNDGTATGATFTTSSKLGSHAGSFDGVNDYVVTGSGSSSDVLNQITISAWVKPTSKKAMKVVTKSNFGSTDWSYALDGWADAIGHYGTPLLGIKNGTNSWMEVYGNTNVTINSWNLITGVYNGSDIIIYLNGVISSTPVHVSGNVVEQSGKYVFLGTNGNATAPNGQFFNGSIDEVAIWNRSLSASEIEDLYNAQIGYHNSSSTVTKDTNQTLSMNLSNGDWLWNVDCTDSLSQTSSSEVFNLSVSYAVASTTCTITSNTTYTNEAIECGADILMVSESSTLTLVNSTINTSSVGIEDGSSIWKDATSRLDISLFISLLRNFIGSLGIVLT